MPALPPMKTHYLINQSAALLVIAATLITLKAERWEQADPMITQRANYSAVSLADGRVLVSGGMTSSGWPPSITHYNTCEIYDPSTERWTLTGSMITPRSMHASVLLDDGRVLVLGGYSAVFVEGPSTQFFATNKCEIYDPSTGVWSPAGNMHKNRAESAVILMPNKKVLITGGDLNGYRTYYPQQGDADCEMYDPITNQFYTTTASMPRGDYGHKLILMKDEKIYKQGAYGVNDCIYDYVSNTWEEINSIGAKNSTLLTNGNLFGLSVVNSYGAIYKTTYSFNSLSKQWTTTGTEITYGGSSSFPLNHQSLITLPSGKVLCNAESIYDPINNIFTPLSHAGRLPVNLLSLPNGRVLTLGGEDSAGTVGPDLPMAIATHPSSLTVKQGDLAEFSVTARGVSLSYLWRKNGKNLGFQTRTLSLSNAQPADQGTYEVLVYSSEGVLTSQPATLTVIGTPVIATQPRNVLSSLGQLARFTLTLTSDSRSGVQYQWFKNGLEIPNSNSATLTLNSVKNTDVGVYHVIASNGAGSVTSDSVRLDLYSQELFQSAMALGFDLGFESGTDSVVTDPNAHGLYNLSQVQALHIGTPLLAKDSATGKFKLTVGVAKSTDLINFSPMPIEAGGATINAEGKMEYQFTAPDNASFYRLESR
jgi:N-acetylneuraminic acid mutarotase